jgi:hypothetical protein
MTEEITRVGTASQLIPARELEAGMWLSDGSAYVVEIHHDDDGLWIEWSDEDCGYMNPNTRVRVEA